MYVQIVVVPLFRFMIRSYSSAITAIEENKTASCGISNTETHKTVLFTLLGFIKFDEALWLVIKTFTENWDSKAPSIITLLVYLETTA